MERTQGRTWGKVTAEEAGMSQCDWSTVFSYLAFVTVL